MRVVYHIRTLMDMTIQPDEAKIQSEPPHLEVGERGGVGHHAAHNPQETTSYTLDPIHWGLTPMRYF